MRVTRAKQYRKLMNQYALTFNFHEPYQVVLDAAIIQAAARFKMRLGPLLEATLQGKIKPMITQCCIRHLYDMEVAETDITGKKLKEDCIAVAKHAERRRCGHHELDKPLSTLECMSSVVDPKASGTNKHRYVVATQDITTRQKMRQVAGVPLIYINRSVMILEPMARLTEQVREREEKDKLRAGLKSRVSEPSLKRKRDDDAPDQDVKDGGEGQTSAEVTEKKRRKAKGPKGPNPLSVKKAKKDPKPVLSNGDSKSETMDMTSASSALTTSNPSKRKRKRSKPQEQEVVAIAGPIEEQ